MLSLSEVTVTKMSEIVRSQSMIHNNHILAPIPIHRELKLDGAIGQGEIYNYLKSEKFSKSFLCHIGKNKYKISEKIIIWL